MTLNGDLPKSFGELRVIEAELDVNLATLELQGGEAKKAYMGTFVRGDEASQVKHTSSERMRRQKSLLRYTMRRTFGQEKRLRRTPLQSYSMMPAWQMPIWISVSAASRTVCRSTP